jgi:rifampin ADP-ribosylating transferase
MKTNRSENKLVDSAENLGSQTFYHGTKAILKSGDLIEPGFNSI